MLLYPGEMVITEANVHEVINPVVAGERKMHGQIPRNYSTHPRGCYSWAKALAKPSDFPIPDRSLWAGIIDDMEANKSRLSDLRMKAGPGGTMIPSRDQNGRGYCWQHSGVAAVIMCRAIMGEPYADLSAYGPACRDKGFADEGGWGAEGLDNLTKWGCPTSKTWPQKATDRKYDNPETWKEAENYKVVSQWADLQTPQYDRKMAFDQFFAFLLGRVCVVADYNRWSHSVLAVDPCKQGATEMRTSMGKMLMKYATAAFDALHEIVGYGDSMFCHRIWNSWSDAFGANGMAVLDPTWQPDGAVAPYLVTPSAA